MSTKKNGLTPYTFKDTGVQVLIRKVSPLLAVTLQQKFPSPTPPMEEVDYGDGKKHYEPNPTHPDYLEALKRYDEENEKRMRTLLLKRGVEIEMTDEAKEEVAALRGFMKDEFGKTLDEDDKMVYISYIAIGSDKDLEELLSAVMRRSQPTEEVVEQAQEAFKSKV